MKVGDLVRDTRCGPLCLFRRFDGTNDAIVISLGLDYELCIEIEHLEPINESR